jgi:hypothetical protein
LARSVHASGTQTCVLTTEHVLVDETDSEGKVFDAILDLGNLTGAEVLEVRVHIKALSTGNLRRAYYAKYYGSQDDAPALKSPIVYVPAMTIAKEWKLTIQQTGGTGRDVDWTVYRD